MILANFFSDWWSALALPKQIFYGIAILASILIIVMAITSMFGIGDDVKVDADAADSGGALFSVKPVIGFLLAFGWAGGAAMSEGLAIWLACVIALVAGLAVMLAIAWVLRATQRLKVDGTLKKEDTIGKIATVYVTIPPNNQSGGQVIVPLDGRTITMDALQKGTEPIPSNTKVKVAALIGSNTALIETI
jgi:membrane protein implicated in regulation of membrane protease activity